MTDLKQKVDDAIMKFNIRSVKDLSGERYETITGIDIAIFDLALKTLKLILEQEAVDDNGLKKGLKKDWIITCKMWDEDSKMQDPFTQGGFAFIDYICDQDGMPRNPAIEKLIKDFNGDNND